MQYDKTLYRMASRLLPVEMPSPELVFPFPLEHLRAASLWPQAAGGLVPWTVHTDESEVGPIITIEPPFGEGRGFNIVRISDGVEITWDHGSRTGWAPDLISALQMICPLPFSALTGLLRDVSLPRRGLPKRAPVASPSPA